MPDKPWRTWPAERPPDATIRLMRSAYEAWVAIAVCWLSPDGFNRVMREFTDPCGPDDEPWGLTEIEWDVLAMYNRGFWCAVAL